MKDVFGQDIQVGDVVIGLNEKYTHKPYVVTRIGAKDNIQVNGSSYISVNHVLKCNEQYIIAYGQQSYDKLIDEYREHFNFTQVKEKGKAIRYAFIRFENYTTRTSQYFVVCVTGNNYNEIVSSFAKHPLIQQFNKGGYGTRYFSVKQSYLGETHNVFHSYKRVVHSISKLTEYFPDIVQFIDREVTDPVIIEKYNKIY